MTREQFEVGDLLFSSVRDDLFLVLMTDPELSNKFVSEMKIMRMEPAASSGRIWINCVRDDAAYWREAGYEVFRGRRS